MTIAFIVVLILCTLRIGCNLNSCDCPTEVGLSILADVIIASIAIWGLVR